MPRRSPSPCLDCGTLTYRSRCDNCHTEWQRARDRQRGTVRQRFGPAWNGLSRRIIERDDGICWICGQPGADTTDHIVPRSQGGTNDDANLAAAHRRCNSQRGSPSF